MSLSPKLELRQSQGLVMTPQLMQSIKLLQMSSLELAAYVEDELERNPLLERGEAEDGARGEEEAVPEQSAEVEDNGEGAPGGDIGFGSHESDLDARAYENVFDTDSPGGSAPMQGPEADAGWASLRGHGGMDIEGNVLEATLAASESLQDHLIRQVVFSIADPAKRLIAGNLIALIDEAGYLSEPVADIAERLGAPEEDVAEVLRAVQGCEPVGVGARSLSECLALQLMERDRCDPAMQALLANLELLAGGDLTALRRVCGVDEEDLRGMIAELRELDPKPGHAFGATPVQPLVPDVIVRQRSDGDWMVELNTEALPRVLLDQTYYARVSQKAASDADRTFLTDCLQQANWLVRSLDQRARTILKTASEIVRQQDAFLARGVRYLRPLNLRMVAEAIEMHESTVSRVTANKYMSTPRGIFELKYFFTSAIAATGGGQSHSAEAVRDRIRALIEAEAPDAVLSDDAIVTLLRDEGVEIARRTVAKYRESIGFPSSVKRRREKAGMA